MVGLHIPCICVQQRERRPLSNQESSRGRGLAGRCEPESVSLASVTLVRWSAHLLLSHLPAEKAADM